MNIGNVASAAAMDTILAPALSPVLSIVVPSFNESGNVAELFRRIELALPGTAYEVIVVDDDSPDGTSTVVKAIAAEDPRIRCIRRVGRRGLAGACIEGILSSSAPVVAVMDADLQHDESLLGQMLNEINAGADLVIGSRYVDGGTSGEGLSPWRQWGSDLATSLAKRLMKVDVADPMSGFFMVRRPIVEKAAKQLAKQGYKILVDLLWTAEKPIKVVELPFTFRERHAGASKLDSLVTVDYLGLLLSKMFGGVLPVRFLMFAAVGFSGIAIHLITLHYARTLLGFDFDLAQFSAVIVAMTWNFFLNNQLTYSDRRLTGFGFVTGLLTFYVACSIGSVANVGVASWIHGFTPTDWVAGLAGAVMGAVFNYAASSVIIWKES